MERIRERVTEGCREAGAAIGVAHAEPFKRLRLG